MIRSFSLAPDAALTAAKLKQESQLQDPGRATKAGFTCPDCASSHSRSPQSAARRSQRGTWCLCSAGCARAAPGTGRASAWQPGRSAAALSAAAAGWPGKQAWGCVTQLRAAAPGRSQQVCSADGIPQSRNTHSLRPPLRILRLPVSALSDLPVFPQELRMA